MADKKVSELGVASALDGSEVLPVVQGAASKQVATKEVARFGYQDIQSATKATSRHPRNLSRRITNKGCTSPASYQRGQGLRGI